MHSNPSRSRAVATSLTQTRANDAITRAFVSLSMLAWAGVAVSLFWH